MTPAANILQMGVDLAPFPFDHVDGRSLAQSTDKGVGRTVQRTGAKRTRAERKMTPDSVCDLDLYGFGLVILHPGVVSKQRQWRTVLCRIAPTKIKVISWLD